MVQANFEGNAAVKEIQKPDDFISVYWGNQDKLSLEPALAILIEVKEEKIVSISQLFISFI